MNKKLLSVALASISLSLGAGQNSSLQVDSVTGQILAPVSGSNFAIANGLFGTNFGGITNGQSGVTLSGPITASNSTNFSGTLSGNVTGPQGATVVSSIPNTTIQAAGIITNNQTNVTLQGTFSGNGSNLFNVQTLYQEVLNYKNLVGITDPNALNALQNFEFSLKQNGLFSLLTNALILYPRFQNTNSSSNVIYSFYGTSGTNYNGVWTQDGLSNIYTAALTTEATIQFVVPITNTTYTVMFTGNTNNPINSAYGYYDIWGLDTVNGNPAAGEQRIEAQNGTWTLYQRTNATAQYVAGVEWWFHDGQAPLLGVDPLRHSLSLSYDGTNTATTMDGIAYPTNTTTASYGFTNSFNYLSIAPNLSATNWNGTVSLVLAFSKALTTNQIALVDQAVRFLDSRNKNVVCYGDSMTAQFDNYGTNYPLADWNYPYQLQKHWLNNALVWNEGYNGFQASSLVAPFYLTNMIGSRGIGNAVSTFDVYVWLGMNDCLRTNGGTNCANVTYTNLLNIWAYCRSVGAQVFASTIQVPDSNTWTVAPAITSTTVSNVLALNALILSDQSKYDKVYRRDIMFPTMNSNYCAWALNGVHPNQFGNNMIMQQILNNNPVATNTISPLQQNTNVVPYGFLGTDGTNQFWSTNGTNWSLYNTYLTNTGFAGKVVMTNNTSSGILITNPIPGSSVAVYTNATNGVLTVYGTNLNGTPAQVRIGPDPVSNQGMLFILNPYYGFAYANAALYDNATGTYLNTPPGNGLTFKIGGGYVATTKLNGTGGFLSDGSFETEGPFTNYGTLVNSNAVYLLTNSLTWNSITSTLTGGGGCMVMYSNVLWSVKLSNNVVVSNKVN